jgi:hypothetical protein
VHDMLGRLVLGCILDQEGEEDTDPWCPSLTPLPSVIAAMDTEGDFYVIRVGMHEDARG